MRWRLDARRTDRIGGTYAAAAGGPLTSAGTYVVTASLANPDYAAPDVSDSLVIARASQSIGLASIPDHELGDAPFAITVTVSSGLDVALAASGPCSLAGASVTLAGLGTCTITASQSGNGDYLPADDVVRSFAVNPPLEVANPGPWRRCRVTSSARTRSSCSVRGTR